MIKRAFTLTELLMAIGVLSIMTLAMSDFSFDTFKVSSEHSKLLDGAAQTRFLEDEISSKVIQAAYIFPPGMTISLSDQSGSTSIDTTNSVAMLILDDNNALNYYLECFYIKDNQVYEFVSSDSRSWSKNTQPYDYFSSASGNSNSIATDISADNSSLEYTLNYENSMSESIFKGQMANATVDDPLALIKGVKWLISRNGGNITIGGISKNVPRFVD